MKTIVWLRRDLRIHDNPALLEASKFGMVVPVYVLEEETERDQPLFGCASAWWLHESLESLKSDLPGLVLRKGDALEVLEELIKESGADSVHWNNRYEPDAMRRDEDVKSKLTNQGISVKCFHGSLLHEPWTTLRKGESPFKVFTPYLRFVKGLPKNSPLEKPNLDSVLDSEDSDNLKDWGLIPDSIEWVSEWKKTWEPGENGALGRLEGFLSSSLKGYANLRDFPSRPNFSLLSPHLHFGEISPNLIWQQVSNACAANRGLEKDADKFLSEIVWREYAHYLLYHYPTLPSENWKPAFNHYPWENDANHLKAWQKGRTGFPIVDAGMRELWKTGYMHNRVRMIVASFLTKHLRIDWRKGAQWFLETLLDADLANNSFGWQWVAGSGADAAPYFRIFNPILQSRKFDPDGSYIRKWCPELAKLDNRFVHEPYEAPAGTLASAGIELGKDYPGPIIDLSVGRKKALDGFDIVKEAGNSQN